MAEGYGGARACESKEVSVAPKKEDGAHTTANPHHPVEAFQINEYEEEGSCGNQDTIDDEWWNGVESQMAFDDVFSREVVKRQLLDED